MPKFVNISQRTPEWINWRKNKISASICSAVMGLSPHETPLMLFNRLIDEKDVQTTSSMDRGVLLEPEARKWAENQLGFNFPESCAEDDELSWLAASLDGYNHEKKAAIEIKCLGKKGHHEAKLGVVKPFYMPQLQCQMRVYNLDQIYYISYDPDEGGEVIQVKRDDMFIDKMIPILDDFRKRLINFLPPDPTDKDLEDLSENKEAKDIVLSLSEIQMQKKIDEAKEGALRERLKQLCNGKSCRVGDFKFVKSMAKGAVEYSKIPELEGIDLEAYRKPHIERWRFS